ncbi:MAG: hypothetical protein ACI4W6_02975, partial [Acutalibacteraceae bacterium]
MDRKKLKKDFFCLISSYLNGTPCEKIDEQEALSLIELATQHALAGILIPLIIKQVDSGNIL